MSIAECPLMTDSVEKVLVICRWEAPGGGGLAMMGRQTGDQSQLFSIRSTSKCDPGESSAATDQSGRDAGAGRAAREPDAVLQRYRATFDRSGAHAADAHCGLLLRYPL